MYRCVRVSPQDSFLQCILWRDSPLEELRTFKLDTVTYGTKPAAFLAVRSMHQLAADESSLYPIGSEVVLRDFYVDDLLTGGDTTNELLEIIRQVSGLLAKGNFKIRKWCSNDTYVSEVVNSRPLCYTPDTEVNYLSPAHFLIGRPLTTILEADFGHIPVGRLGYWQSILSMYQGFWKQWHQSATASKMDHVNP
ncbi:GL16619 [Drosophila persimilis]|uniref:GL16619 n=1 Tax=Drosophila persimilis TaxID=7234 RepID=B4HCV1_DROPE|nr:GL16619 [Drosophila persimilis]